MRISLQRPKFRMPVPSYGKTYVNVASCTIGIPFVADAAGYWPMAKADRPGCTKH